MPFIYRRLLLMQIVDFIFQNVGALIYVAYSTKPRLQSWLVDNSTGLRFFGYKIAKMPSCKRD